MQQIEIPAILVRSESGPVLRAWRRSRTSWDLHSCRAKWRRELRAWQPLCGDLEI